MGRKPRSLEGLLLLLLLLLLLMLLMLLLLLLLLLLQHLRVFLTRGRECLAIAQDETR